MYSEGTEFILFLLLYTALLLSHFIEPVIIYIIFWQNLTIAETLTNSNSFVHFTSHTDLAHHVST